MPTITYGMFYTSVLSQRQKESYQFMLNDYELYGTE